MNTKMETFRITALLWMVALSFGTFSFADEVPKNSANVPLDSSSVPLDTARAPLDSTNVPLDSSKAVFDSTNAALNSAEALLASFSNASETQDSVIVRQDSKQDSTMQGIEIQDSLQNAWIQDSVKLLPAEHKTVLYIDGSKNSAWFTLGVLYAFENYGVRVDSVVATSYGAWVAALWKSGYSLDDIQLELRRAGEYPERFDSEQKFLPLADSGLPAIRARIAVNFDSTGKADFRNIPLQINRKKVDAQKHRLHLEEVLYRKPISSSVSVALCDGSLKSGPGAIVSTMPFEGNLYGNGCKIPLPSAEDSNSSLIVSAVPLREPAHASTQERIAFMATSSELEGYGESAVVIRPLFLPGDSPEKLIQSGFSETEKKLSAISARQSLKPYTTVSDFVKPWFRYALASDSVPAEQQQHLMSYWDESDTGFVAIENFLDRIAESSMYESVDLQIQPNGTLLMQASAPFQVDLRAGGFGNSIFGPFAYGDARIRYVNQFEYELGTSVYYGLGGYGATPELKLRRFLQGSFDFGVRYEFMCLRPLQSYLNEQSYRHKIYEERRGDLVLSVDFYPSESQQLTLSTRVGSHEYKIHEHYSESAIKVSPLSPEIRMVQASKGFDKWFGTSGYITDGSVGLESVGASFGNGESVPIFGKYKALVAGAVSPFRFLTFGGGAALGANLYREEGEDFPPSFGYEPIDWTIRQGIEATPWSAEWYSAESRSHEYGLLRANIGLGGGPLHFWLFGAFVRDFENPAGAIYSKNRIVLEPAMRFALGSLTMYAGLSRTVSASDYHDLVDFANYHYFVKVGDFDF